MHFAVAVCFEAVFLLLCLCDGNCATEAFVAGPLLVKKSFNRCAYRLTRREWDKKQEIDCRLNSKCIYIYMDALWWARQALTIL